MSEKTISTIDYPLTIKPELISIYYLSIVYTNINFKTLMHLDRLTRE